MTEIATLTISAVNYSVYGITSDALLDANNYLAASITSTTWATKTDDEKKKLLISAFRLFERTRWSGTADTPATAQWPRSDATCNGDAITDSVIPADVVEAQFELAASLADSTNTLTSNSTDSNIKKVVAGSAEVEYFYPLSAAGTRFPLPVQELIGCYLAGNGASLSTLLPFVGGQTTLSDGTTLNSSTFSTLDTGRNGGFA
jgi:hypothetical protein